MVRDEPHAGERNGAFFPALAGVAPALQEVVRVRPVARRIGRVEFCEPVGERLGDSLDVAWMQVYVRIPLRVHVAL